MLTYLKSKNNHMNKTIAQQLNIKDFPFEIKYKNGNQIYYEDSNGYWRKFEYNQNGKQIYFEDSSGYWENVLNAQLVIGVKLSMTRMVIESILKNQLVISKITEQKSLS